MSATLGMITRLLNEAYEGREEAFDEVMELVYEDLRRLARRHLRQRYGSHEAVISLESADLVHEAFLKLITQRKRYDSRGHFFAIATRAMLRVLMDYDRARKRAKRGGDYVRVSLRSVARTIGQDASVNIPAFVEAMERLEGLDARTADVTKMRLLWGLTVAETAESLDMSVSTVEREWRFARRWLMGELKGAEP